MALADRPAADRRRRARTATRAHGLTSASDAPQGADGERDFERARARADHAAGGPRFTAPRRGSPGRHGVAASPPARRRPGARARTPRVGDETAPRSASARALQGRAGTGIVALAAARHLEAPRAEFGRAQRPNEKRARRRRRRRGERADTQRARAREQQPTRAERATRPRETRAASPSGNRSFARRLPPNFCAHVDLLANKHRALTSREMRASKAAAAAALLLGACRRARDAVADRRAVRAADRPRRRELRGVRCALLRPRRADALRHARASTRNCSTSPTSANENVWLGYNDQASEGAWEWEHGCSSDYTNVSIGPLSPSRSLMLFRDARFVLRAPWQGRRALLSRTTPAARTAPSCTPYTYAGVWNDISCAASTRARASCSRGRGRASRRGELGADAPPRRSPRASSCRPTSAP